MRVLVLGENLKDRALIEQVLQAGAHDLVTATNADQAWKLIHTGEARFVIADADGPDAVTTDLVQRTRQAGLLPVYFLFLTSNEELVAEADDILHKPLRAGELKTRVAIGQRILKMTDSLSQARDQLENVAMYDPLTGMLNQAAFNRLALGELERARRSSAPFSIIALEIDNFNTLESQHGIEARNNALRLVTTSLRERSRPYDCIGRWEGAEFILALFGVNGPFAEKIAERIITGIRSIDINFQGTVLRVAMSAGIATALSGDELADVQGLLLQARQAVMQAQEAGSYKIFFANAGVQPDR